METSTRFTKLGNWRGKRGKTECFWTVCCWGGTHVCMRKQMSYQHIKVLFSLEFYHLAGLKVTKVIWKMTSACGNMTQVVSHTYTNTSLKVLQVKGSSRRGAHGSLTDMDIKVHSHVHVFTTQVTHTYTWHTKLCWFSWFTICKK